MRSTRQPLRSVVALVIALMFATLVAACGTESAHAPAPSKPTGYGTPVNGAYQAPSTHADGHYESLLADGATLYAGSDNDNVYAFDAASGAVRWRHNIGGSALVYGVAGGAVVTLSQGDTTAMMFALSAADGHVLWQRQMPQNDAGGEPLVTSAAIYIPVSPNTGSAAVLALSPTDGAQLWQYTTPDDVRGFGGVANGALYVTTDDPMTTVYTLVVLDTTTGKQLWRYTPPEALPLGPNSSYGGPVVAGGTVYLTIDAASNGLVSAGTLVALDATTGRQLWRYSIAGENFSNPPVAVDGVVYVLGTGGLYALRSMDGQLLWRVPGAAALGGGQQNGSTPLVAAGGVYFASGDCRITAFRASDGSQMWQQHINDSVYALFEESGRIDVATQLNGTYALSAGDGHLLWTRQQTTGVFHSWDAGAPSAVVAGGVIYTGTDRGVIQAIRASDSKELWHYAAPPKAVPPLPIYRASVTLDVLAPFDTELQAFADPGLQPIQLCVWLNWPWRAPHFNNEAELALAATPSSPLGWYRQLSKLPDVINVRPNPTEGCPLMGYDAPPAGTVTYLPSAQAGTVARVRFSAATAYGAALDTIAELGFRLADPCYERQPKGAPVAWHSMGQEQSYATTHALIVMTTYQNSTHWEQQAQGSVGVAGVDVNPALSC